MEMEIRELPVHSAELAAVHHFAKKRAQLYYAGPFL